MKGRLGEDVLLATGVGGAIDVATGAAPYLLCRRWRLPSCSRCILRV